MLERLQRLLERRLTAQRTKRLTEQMTLAHQLKMTNYLVVRHLSWCPRSPLPKVTNYPIVRHLLMRAKLQMGHRLTMMNDPLKRDRGR